MFSKFMSKGSDLRHDRSVKIGNGHGQISMILSLLSSAKASGVDCT